jgi:uncharacterized iron-regulated membrane protein
MKAAFRQSMAWLHTWCGLLVGWVLFFMFVTGTAGYFDTEIDRWMQPERPAMTSQASSAEMAAVALRRLQERAPAAERWFIGLPWDRNEPDLRILWRDPPRADGKRGASKNEILDVATGQPIAGRATGGGQLLYRMHYMLHYLPTNAAYWIVGICTMFMFVAITTGVIIHRKIFRDFFTFRPARGQRSWLDMHNVLSVAALPFHVMITYSGLIFFLYIYMAPVVTATFGPGETNRDAFFDELFERTRPPARSGVAAPLVPIDKVFADAARHWGSGDVRYIEIYNPGDTNARVTVGQPQDTPLRSSARLYFDGASGAFLKADAAVLSAPKAVRDVLLGLHEGLFAGPVLRWLYFLSGLMGTAMIGAGLVLWTEKRRARLKAAGRGPHPGVVVVERLNVGVILGLPIGLAVYFWANRLIPIALDGRAAWEAHAMFIVWGVALLWSAVRPPARAWRELMWPAALAYLLVPVLNALTTDRHLGATLPLGGREGDWALAGFDLTMLGIGLVFAAAGWRLRRRNRASAALPGIAPLRTEPAE